MTSVSASPAPARRKVILEDDIDGFTPAYKVLSEEGPDHDKVFTLGVFVGEKQMGEGVGPSKQAAQQELWTDG